MSGKLSAGGGRVELGLKVDEIWVEEPGKSSWNKCKAGSGVKRPTWLGQGNHICGNQAKRGLEKQCGTLVGGS